MEGVQRSEYKIMKNVDEDEEEISNRKIAQHECHRATRIQQIIRCLLESIEIRFSSSEACGRGCHSTEE